MQISFGVSALHDSKSSPLFGSQALHPPAMDRRLSPHSYPAFRLHISLMLVNAARMRVLLRTCLSLHAVGPVFRFLHHL